MGHFTNLELFSILSDLQYLIDHAQPQGIEFLWEHRNLLEDAIQRGDLYLLRAFSEHI